jgi:hypothetical protein
MVESLYIAAAHGQYLLGITEIAVNVKWLSTVPREVTVRC